MLFIMSYTIWYSDLEKVYIITCQVPKNLSNIFLELKIFIQLTVILLLMYHV